jgi:hypothetical protein
MSGSLLEQFDKQSCPRFIRAYERELHKPTEGGGTLIFEISLPLIEFFNRR